VIHIIINAQVSNNISCNNKWGLEGWHIKWLRIFERTCDTLGNKINVYIWHVELIDTKINETNLVVFRITF
jgi:hypothetical protein